MTTATRTVRLSVEHTEERLSATRPGVVDFHESTALYRRDTLVLYVYRTTGMGWAYHVLVGRPAQFAVGGFITHDAALKDGMLALRRVKGYDALHAPVVW